MPDSPWLSSTEQRTWRRWLRLNALLPAALHRGLQLDAGLSLPDFEVLVQLTDLPEGRARVAELARGLHWERSRASHHITRMERRRLVKREACSDDGRGAWVKLTDEGRAAIEQAAPGHAETVRRLVFKALTPEEVDLLSTVIGKLLAQLDEEETLASAL